MKRRGQSAIEYILMFAIALVAVLFVYRMIKPKPQVAANEINSATEAYKTTISQTG